MDEVVVIPDVKMRTEIEEKIDLKDGVDMKPCDCTACSSCRCTPCK